MIASHNESRVPKTRPPGSQLPKYLESDDSDDDENQIEPPALSSYALELLQREKENVAPATNENQIHEHRQHQHHMKRVNFRSSPGDRLNIKQHHGENHVLSTANSASETIFSKAAPGHLESTATTLEKTQKTPLNRSSGSDLGSVHNSQTRLRTSTRRRGLSGLGPPKRASVTGQEAPSAPSDPVPPTTDISMRGHEHETPVVKSTFTRSPGSYHTPVKPNLSSTPLSQPHGSTPMENIDLKGMNPQQYANAHGLPRSEIPMITKVYLAQQKAAAKEALTHNSPFRFKEVMQHQIEERLQQLASPDRRYEPKPEKELFKLEKSTRAEPQAKEAIRVHDDKENADMPFKRVISSIERPKSTRQPLAPLSNTRQQPLEKPRASLSNQYENRRGDYHEQYSKQIRPLKDGDNSRSSKQLISVNGRQYEKLDLMGKGGSSKVFRVKSIGGQVFALKQIIFDEFDAASIAGFKGEIDLLLKLRDQERVVKLVDYALLHGSLSLVMECGEHDLSLVLNKRLEMPMDPAFVRFFGAEILKCVKAVHDAGIVHSDLKPANFLLVKGIVKIIDFGIANAVPEHTMNIYRESQIGTPNYMAPEALTQNNQQLAGGSQHKGQWKVGKPADIWSCGCIIYQMIYGRPPYAGYDGMQRIFAIMNPEVKIAYPEKGLGGVKVPATAIHTMKACLARDPNERWTAGELLEGPFLNPRVVSEQFINDLVTNAIKYGAEKKEIGDEELKSLADDVWRRVSQLRL